MTNPMTKPMKKPTPHQRLTGDFNDCLDDLSQFNAALHAVVDMLAGCGDGDAPPASYLWHLLAILGRYGDDIELKAKHIRQALKEAPKNAHFGK